jgi:hypothetical protein
VLNDNRPELQERFEVRLVSAQSNDGKDESTATSGASVNPLFSIANLTIEENDSPYGLLQFASEVPRNASISPLTHAFKMDVRESAGTFKLYIERAQGIVGGCMELWASSLPLTPQLVTAAEGKRGTSLKGRGRVLGPCLARI